ncbi:MAG: hypothetical protein KAV80_01955 [Methanomicrobia archaeon]|nr:hypothetical protein [Methanomicrobia archaeon]
MDGRIIADISVLIFFMILIVLRKYLFTEGFLKFLKKYWPAFSFPVAIVLIHFTSEKPSPYQEFIVIIGLFFVGYFFLYGYFSVNISSLRNRKGFRKKWQIVVLPFISILTFDQAYEYFTTQPYHILDIVIFIFFLGTVIYVSRFLLKETFFSKVGE